jgi:diaminopropionate ammonia-lyase
MHCGTQVCPGLLLPPSQHDKRNQCLKSQMRAHSRRVLIERDDYAALMQLRNSARPRQDARRLFRPNADRPLALLQRCPAYAPTPLRDLPALAETLGIASLALKDETTRMRLGSFKALGGAYAVAQMIIDASGDPDPMSERARNVARGMTFITASAGNHGLSVAAGARIFGAKSVIVLSSLVPEAFAGRIRGAGAQVMRIEGTYEDSVAAAIAAAERNGWLLLADGSWDGYVDRPALVMEGYTVLAEECRDVFAARNDWPSHVVLQAGVGGLAAAVAAHIREHWDRQPEIVVAEPDAAPCLFRSIEAGRLTRADGPVSNMGRLDCKDASLIAFSALRRDADLFVTVSDEHARSAAGLLGRHGVATTPSGAAGLAGLASLNLERNARALVIATEGAESG